jgi:hypothetical protein
MKIAGGLERSQGAEGSDGIFGPARNSAMDKEVFVFPLSFARQRLWFLDQLGTGPGTGPGLAFQTNRVLCNVSRPDPSS